MRRGASRAGRARNLLGLAVLLAVGLAGLGASLLGVEDEAAFDGAARPPALAGLAGEAPVPASAARPPAPEAAARTALALAPDPDASAGPAPARAWSGEVRARGSGRPLAGARVTLTAGELELATQTDDAGRFELAWPADDLPPAAEATHPGHAPARRPRVDLDRPGRFELDPTGALTGTVRGPRPHEARVRVWELGRARGARDEPLEAPVAGDGSFELAGLVPGEYSVLATAPGCAPTSESRVLVRAGARRELRLSLEPGLRLRGVVRLESSGEPVAGARIDLRAERQGLWRELERGGELRAETGADGRFELAGLPAGTCRLEVRAPWGGREELELEVPARGGLLEREIPIARPAGLAGRVVDRAGAAAADAWVLAQWGARSLAFELFERAELPGISEGSGGVLRTRADAAGRFAFDELPAGRDLLLLASDARVDAAAARGWAHGLRLGSGERREELELTLRVAATVTGRVVGADGAPLAAARVRALRREDRTWLRCGEARSDVDGAFTLSGLPPGPYLVEARLEGHERRRERVELAEGDEAALELQLEPAPLAWGRVVDGDGYGVPFARVRLVPLPSERGGPGRGARAVRLSERRGGRYVAEGVPRAGYRLRVSKRGYVGARRELELAGRASRSARVVLQEREEGG